MQQLTEQFMVYRECVRLTWNLFFRKIDDGEHQFSDVATALFSGMIESQCERPEKPQTFETENYYRFLRLLPQTESSPLRALSVREVNDKRVWSEENLNWGDVDLRFSTLFDFLTLDGNFREFRYVYAIVVDSTSSKVRAGEPLLVEADRIVLMDISSSKQ